jgi:hypothetical protein
MEISSEAEVTIKAEGIKTITFILPLRIAKLWVKRLAKKYKWEQ